MRIYKVVSAGNKEELVKKVNNSIKNGWSIVGGVSVRSVRTTWTNFMSPPDEFFQAMEKHDETN